jgi:hypothetical protein
MHAVLEYLAVGVLLIVVLLAASRMIEAPSSTLEAVRGEQLLTVAERVIDKILLTAGYPPDWGSNVDVNRTCKPGESGLCLSDFGLALQGGAPYIVDPDKVMRLTNLSTLPNPLYLSAENLTCLLGLGTCDARGNLVRADYGFRLVMKPMITARVEALEWRSLGRGSAATKFRVRVVNWLGEGLPNANVTGVYMIAMVKGGAAQAGEIEGFYNYTGRCVTDALGYCALDFSGAIAANPPQGRGGSTPASFLVLHISWEGFASVVGYSPVPGGAPLTGYIIGNYVFLSKDYEAGELQYQGRVSGAVIVKDEVVQVVPLYSTLLDLTEVEWCRNQPNDPAWCQQVAGNVLPSRRGAYLIGRIEYLEVLSSHVIVFAKWRGSWTAVAISRIPEVDVSFGPRGAKPANSVTVTRVTQLYNYPYVVQLTVWRWAEGWP